MSGEKSQDESGKASEPQSTAGSVISARVAIALRERTAHESLRQTCDALLYYVFYGDDENKVAYQTLKRLGWTGDQMLDRHRELFQEGSRLYGGAEAPAD